MVLGIRRIDGDEGQRAPILAPFQGGGLRLLRLFKDGLGEYIGDAVGVDRDQADRLLGFDRAQAFLHLGGRQAEPAMLDHRDRDQIAVLRLAFVAGPDLELQLARLLVDGNETAAALRQGAEDAEHLRLLLGDDLGHAAGIAVEIAGLERIDPQQRPVADAGHRHAGMRLARRDDDDGGDRAVFRLVPLGRNRDQLAVPVTFRDVRQDDGRQLAGLVDALAARSTTPSTSRSFSTFFSQIRSLPLMPKRCAISRLPTLPWAWAMKETTSSREGRAGSAFGRLAKGEALRVHQVLSHASLAAASPAAWDL